MAMVISCADYSDYAIMLRSNAKIAQVRKPVARIAD
jgi:hypothetical protein